MVILCCYSNIAIVRVNHCLPLLHTSKIFVNVNTTEKQINQFYVGYMNNTTSHVNNVFRNQVEI